MPKPFPLHQEPKPICQPKITHRIVKSRLKHTYSDPEYLLLQHHISGTSVSSLLENKCGRNFHENGNSLKYYNFSLIETHTALRTLRSICSEGCKKSPRMIKNANVQNFTIWQPFDVLGSDLVTPKSRFKQIQIF